MHRRLRGVGEQRRLALNATLERTAWRPDRFRRGNAALGKVVYGFRFVDDDPQVGCHTDFDAADCAAEHGTIVEATSCDPNPCVPVPPVQVVTCCVEEDDEVECQFRTPDLCAAKGGTVSASATCDPNPCGGTSDADDDDGDYGDGEHCNHHGHDGSSGSGGHDGDGDDHDDGD